MPRLFWLMIAAMVLMVVVAVAAPLTPQGRTGNDPDSLHLMLRWQEVVPVTTDSTEQLAIAGYDTRLVLAGDTIYQTLVRADVFQDSVAVAYPAPTTCIGPVVALVRAVDVALNEGGWASSLAFNVCRGRTVIGPSPPLGVVIDTIRRERVVLAPSVPVFRGIDSIGVPGAVSDLHVVSDTT